MNTFIHWTCSSFEVWGFSVKRKIGQSIAARVPIVLLSPVKIAAWLGAMSNRFALRPETAMAELATAKAIPTEARVWLSAKVTSRRKTASPPKPPQPKIFLTVVVFKTCFILKRSARRPVRGTMMVISM